MLHYARGVAYHLHQGLAYGTVARNEDAAGAVGFQFEELLVEALQGLSLMVCLHFYAHYSVLELYVVPEYAAAVQHAVDSAADAVFVNVARGYQVYAVVLAAEAYPAFLAGEVVHRGPRIVRIEGVQDVYLDSGFLRRFHCRRIEYLCAVFGHPPRRFVGDARDGVRLRQVLGVGGHYARHVGPDLQGFGSGTRGEQRRAVVRASPSQRGYASVPVSGNKSRSHEHAHRAPVLYCGGNVGVCRLQIVLDDYFAGVQPLHLNAVAGQFARYDAGGEDFSEGFRDGRALLYLVEYAAALFQGFIPLDSGEKPGDYLLVAFFKFRYAVLVMDYAFSYPDEGVGAAADGGTHQDHAVFAGCVTHYVQYPGDICSGGYRGAAELEYLHLLSVVFVFRKPYQGVYAADFSIVLGAYQQCVRSIYNYIILESFHSQQLLFVGCGYDTVPVVGTD